MKAWKLTDVGKIEYMDSAEMPSIDQNEVLIHVKAAGICGSDVARVYETGAHRMPLTIGHEFAGTVEKIGSRVDDKWQGKRVGIFPLIPCKSCSACMEKKYEMCIQYGYLGSRRDGGFAEYVAVPEWNLIELPDEVSFEQAAMLEPMAVAAHAMRQLDIAYEGNVVVCGMGTIGQLIVMFLLKRGIENVFAIGNKESQKAVLSETGLKSENFFNISSGESVKEWVMIKTHGLGADAYIECVGKNETIAQAPILTKAGGQICMVGNPYGDISMSKEVYWQILRKQLTVKGTWNSSYLGEMDEEAGSDDWNYVLSWLKSGKIAPEKLISHRLGLEDLKIGLEIMKDKTEDYTKIMIVMD